MTALRSRPRRLPLALLGTAVAASVLLAAPASAHNYLVASTPADGSTLTALPEVFSITTNEDMLDLGGEGSGFVLQVTDAQGLFYGDGCVTVAGDTMSTPAALGAAGPYTATWQAVSIDGHTVSDALAFTWAPAADAPVSAGSATAPVCGTPAVPAAPVAPAASPSASAAPDASATPDAVPSGAVDPEPTASAASAPATDTGQGPGTAVVVGGSVLAAAGAVAGATVLSRRRRPGA